MSVKYVITDMILIINQIVVQYVISVTVINVHKELMLLLNPVQHVNRDIKLTLMAPNVLLSRIVVVPYVQMEHQLVFTIMLPTLLNVFNVLPVIFFIKANAIHPHLQHVTFMDVKYVRAGCLHPLVFNVNNHLLMQMVIVLHRIAITV